MKGIEKITYAMLAIILLLVVLLAAVYFVYLSKESIDVLVLENSLKQCCSKYCVGQDITVACNVPSGQESFLELADKVGITNYNQFCNC